MLTVTVLATPFLSVAVKTISLVPTGTGVK